MYYQLYHVPAPTFYPSLWFTCVFFSLSYFIRLLFALFMFVDITGMSLCQTDVSSLQMNVVVSSEYDEYDVCDTKRPDNTMTLTPTVRRNKHTSTLGYTRHKVEVEQVSFRQIHALVCVRAYRTHV